MTYQRDDFLSGIECCCCHEQPTAFGERLGKIMPWGAWRCSGCSYVGVPHSLHFAGNGAPGVITPSDGDCDSLADWGSYYDVARRVYEEAK